MWMGMDLMTCFKSNISNYLRKLIYLIGLFRQWFRIDGTVINLFKFNFLFVFYLIIIIILYKTNIYKV
jgi:hypothetical protein